MEYRSDSGNSLERIDEHTEYEFCVHANSLTEDDLLQHIEEVKPTKRYGSLKVKPTKAAAASGTTGSREIYYK